MNIKLHPHRRYKPLGDLFGLFFEDLNHAADGGLYAELIKNRDFEFASVDRPEYHPLTGWSALGGADVSVQSGEAPFENNPHYTVVRAERGGGIRASGFGEGIAVQAGKTYRLTVWARADKPVKITADLSGARAELELTAGWTRHLAELIPSKSDAAAHLDLTAGESGTFMLAFVSLMPADTWKGRENGLRADIVQALADMKPRFLRFPGGCLTHDGELDPDSRCGIYNWKRTVGTVENRPARRNNWGYHQTMGLGFYEYFLLCEDIGCEPLPVVNGGLDPHHLRFAEGELLEQYIQDALDLIDFAKGGADTQWGAVRAAMGHPEPFGLHYLAVGNEEIHERFHLNMARFAGAIRQKDPSIRLIGSAGPVIHGKPYDMGWQYAREQGLDYVDEHYYQAPEWFLAHADHYDDYPADGPKVFLGEYASWGNRMENALAEAAYMTGLQNAPGVGLACYAPMLCNAAYVNWSPDMLWFDNRRICKTPNYHVQSMFMRHQGDAAIELTAQDNEPGESRSREIAGELLILADDTGLDLSDISLTTAEGETALPDAHIEGRERLTIGHTQGDFTLRLHLRRTAGRKGALIRFAYLDEDNHYQWTVGGWQNSDSGLECRIRGRGSCLTQSNLYLQDGRTYSLELRVRGRELTALIDGEEINRVTDRELRIKPLYLAASVEDATGDVILKAVNVQANPVRARIGLLCMSYTAETLCAAPNAQNTLDQPENVAPVLTRGTASGPLLYTFPGYSVTILRMQCR